MINDESNDNLVETVFLKNNESKGLVNIIGDRDLPVGNKSKCEDEKIKGENGKNAAVNLRTQANRPLIDRKAYLDKNSNLRNSLVFPKVFYATILKQPIRTVRPTSALVYVLLQAFASLIVSGYSHDLTQGGDSLLEILQSLEVSNDSFLETDSDHIKGSFSSDSVFDLSKKVLLKTEIKVDSPLAKVLEKFQLEFDFIVL